MKCECAYDGFCTRYNREMYGRMRELCQGINVDIGTAAAFRAQWQTELPPLAEPPRKILLKTNQAPGDAVAMTAAVYSLHKAYPGRYLTAVESLYSDVFANNPNVVPATNDFEPLEMHYPAIHQSNSRGIHFMQGWCEFLGLALEIPIPLLTNRPMLYGIVPKQENYWIICSGVKTDFTCKQWDKYQEVVDKLRGQIQFVQIGMHQPKLQGVIDLVDKTSLREMFQVIANAHGILCGVSLPMHVAAAFNKPAIIVAGGREPVQWNAYPQQHYIHTIGSMDCCLDGGCWKSRVVPLGDNTLLDASLCTYPINAIPKCMNKITSIEITNLVLRL